jgi:hypothetical protein
VSINRIRSELRKLAAANRPDRFDWEAWRLRQEQRCWRDLEDFFALLPETRHEALKALLVPGVQYWVPCGTISPDPFYDRPEGGYHIPNPVAINHRSLAGLYGRLSRRDLSVHVGNHPKIPEAVFDAYLADQWLNHTLGCSGCNMLLPECCGVWAHDQKPDDWRQGKMVPLTTCPGCNTVAITRSPGDCLPTAPAPGWRFLSNSERWAQKTAAEQTPLASNA